MSGSGKTTLAMSVKEILHERGVNVEIIDGDEYRKLLCADLGFSRADRNQNIRRLAFVASKLSQYNIVAIICAINPYEEIRNEVAATYPNVRTVFIDCDLKTLIQRDTKGLYKKALLPDTHPDKLTNLSGVNDPFEIPGNADLIVRSGVETISESTDKLFQFIIQSITKAPLV